ncbi:MAG TPA: DUF3667 domain-containing protein, partial [Cyclobacteriaceae bacterium]
NCGTKLTDTFCAHCGQKDIPRRQTLGDMLTNFISSFWSYEGKFFLTTKYLVTKPGFLAEEYNAGRRESYYHPARMYVFISFVFFLIFFSLPDKVDLGKPQVNIKMDREDLKELNDEFTEADLDSILASVPADSKNPKLKLFTSALLDSIKKKSKKANSDNSVTWLGNDYKKYKSVAGYDSIQQTLTEDRRDGWITRRMNIRSLELQQKYGNDFGQFLKDFWSVFKDNFSKILFWLLPFFALLLKLLYVRRDFYYSEHLVFTIYYYNFFYLAASIQLLIGLVPALDWLGNLIGFWIVLYLLFGMKRLYRQSWRKTIVKYLLFLFVFSFLLGIALSITTFAVIMTI